MSWINRWRKGRARRALDAAQRAQDRERDAARQRIADLAKRTPEWNSATRQLPAIPAAAPLLTRGQIDRTGRRP